MTLIYFSRSVRYLNCQIWAKRCLCAQYLMNQLADFNQICINITAGHDKKLNKFWLDLIFKVTVRLNPPKLSQKVFVCMLSLIRWNVNKFSSLYKADRINSLLDFQGHGFVTEMATIDWFGRWGTSVFSENTAIFAFSFTSQQYLGQFNCLE